MTWRIVAALSALALLLAACGSDSDTSDSSPEPPTAETSSPSPSEEETPPPTTTATPSASAAEESDEEPAEPLTSSDRGVSPETIRLGLAITDVSDFANVGAIEPRFQAAVSALNDAGGVNGRRVELVVEEWPLGDVVGLSTSCTVLTEDNEVFIVLGWATAVDLSCYTDIHEHIVINSFDTPAEIDPLLFTVLADPVETMLSNLDLIEAELAGSRVAIHAADGFDTAFPEARAAVESLGGEVVVETTGSSVESRADELTINEESDIFVERWSADGAEYVLNLGGGQATLGALDRVGSEITMIGYNSNVQSLGALGTDIAAVDLLVIASPTVNDDADAGLYGISACIETIEMATGDDILTRPGEDDEAGLASTVAACAVVDAFAAIATAAGAELTRTGFLDAMEPLGQFVMTGAQSASLGPTKHHAANSAALLYVYDAGLGDFVSR
jgi:hypothetical protein